jgi:hypothetical protein
MNVSRDRNVIRTDRVEKNQRRGYRGQRDDKSIVHHNGHDGRNEKA